MSDKVSRMKSAHAGHFHVTWDTDVPHKNKWHVGHFITILMIIRIIILLLITGAGELKNLGDIKV